MIKSFKELEIKEIRSSHISLLTSYISVVEEHSIVGRR